MFHRSVPTIFRRIFNTTAEEFQKNSLWIYTIRILYSLLAILFLATLIVPSTLVYLLASRSSQTGMTQLPTYTNHCAGISPYTLWQINSNTTITMIINTTQCSFPKTPLYFVSIRGFGSQFCLLGYDAIYFPTSKSFQIYTRYGCSVIVNSTFLFSLSQTNVYNVNWAGFYT